MKTLELDPNFFMQIGLDSGALTMHGAVAHSFREPGEYRGVVRRETMPEATFYVSADRNSPVAHVNIDLARLVGDAPTGSDCCKGEGGNRFVVNPKGYALFHVSGGAGGYSVHIRKAEEDPKTKVFDTRHLEEGDVFSAIILRPGTYSVKNLITQAEGEVTVSYPVIGKTAYRPPQPVTVECVRGTFNPREIRLQPGQGVNYRIHVPSRIRIELIRPDDGPGGQHREAAKGGWRKYSLPKR